MSKGLINSKDLGYFYITALKNGDLKAKGNAWF